MRIHILSDLHLEFAPFVPPKVDADAIVLAGDIHVGRNGLRWIRETWQDTPVIYVLGNHEFYGQKHPKLVNQLKEAAAGSNVHILENDLIEIADIAFLGATLWTDFRLDGDPVLAEVAAATNMTDFRRIRVLPTYRRFRPADARRLHAQSLEWLEQRGLDLFEKTTVVVTHHAPSPKSIPLHYRNHPLNPAYTSNLETFIDSMGADLWIHGHIHNASDYQAGSTRVIANPRGYPGDAHSGFNSSLVIEV